MLVYVRYLPYAIRRLVDGSGVTFVAFARTPISVPNAGHSYCEKYLLLRYWNGIRR